jgi:seryl-tRNA synthetase
MLDIKLIREKPGMVRKNLRKRGEKDVLEWLDELIKSDGRWRTSLRKIESLRHRRNQATQEIASLKRQGKSTGKLIREIKGIPSKIKDLEERNDKYREKVDFYLMRIPNMLHDSVPKGKDENDNKEVKRWGKAPKFSFRPRNHQDIAESLGLMDGEGAAKVAGSGFYYLKGELALLDIAIQKYSLDLLRKKGYTIVQPPLMMRRKPYEGVTDLGDFESMMYKIEEDDLYLIATSEHPLAAMYMDDILDKGKLPVKLCGVSPCFRREIGAHGKYTKGLFRTHHFNKVEQFIFCLPEDSWNLHEELQRNSDDLYQGLGLHYRVVNVCTGDIGSLAAKKYDTEIWMADRKFREIGSNSNCTDYQARRLNIRYREKEGQSPVGFVHTLNNTALATSRTMVAILEQYQQKDGSVVVPKALRPYMGKMDVISARKV